LAIIYQYGDLLKSDCNIIAHQANCYKVMGAGIAKQIKKELPSAWQADQLDKRTAHQRLGGVTWAAISTEQHPTIRLAFNLYGQLNFGSDKKQTDYGSLSLALLRMNAVIRELDFQEPIKIGFPKGMGCGLAGGDWSVVSEIIEKNFSNQDVFCYYI